MPDDHDAKQSLLDASRHLYKVFGKHRGQSNWTDALRCVIGGLREPSGTILREGVDRL